MKIPKKVKIGGHIYKVDEDYKFIERSDLQGLCDHYQRAIFITPFDTNGSKRERTGIEETFIHELIHCVDEIYNGKKLEEETVKRISEGLYQVLKDNNLLK